ncbi:MAG: GGDEF domain-containing protein [Micrococcales bacterium]|nr:GGDEF domain-containing protein [Micrococcales bacterium]
MPGTTWALVGAGAVTVVITGVQAARQRRRRRDAPWASRALHGGVALWGVALWTLLAVVVQVTGWWWGAPLVLLPATLIAGVVAATALLQAGLSGWVRPTTALVFAVVPGVTALVGLLPGAHSWVVDDDATWYAGGLLQVTVVWLLTAVACAALLEIGAAALAVGPLRTDIVRHGIATLVALTVATSLLLPDRRSWFGWVPIALFALSVPLARWVGPERPPLPAATPSVLDIVSDALAVIGLDGTVIYLNRTGARLLSADDPSTLDPVLIPVLAGDGERTLTLGGAVLRVRTTTVYENGIAVARILSARDITELDRLRSELVEQAARDALTGLLNRRNLNRHLGALVADAHRTGRPLSIAMIDLDHLKELNDRFGHSIGDRGIVGVAQVLSESADDDLVVRVGGDEFLVALVGTDADAAELRGQLWRIGVGRLCLGPDVPRMTLSIGIAQLEPQMDADTFVTAADGALYAAKTAGRNRVRVRTARTGPVQTGAER